MADLATLKAAADQAGAAFDLACRPHFCGGRWGAYLAAEKGTPLPPEVESAMDSYIAATHAFYLARDGHCGLLGGTGA